MTEYIPGPPKGKGGLIELYGGVQVSVPSSVPSKLPDKGTLVCVVDNGAFEAAAIVTGDRDLRDFSDPADLRLKTWYLLSDEVLAFVKDGL
jgi:hypothetical protein